MPPAAAPGWVSMPRGRCLAARPPPPGARPAARDVARRPPGSHGVARVGRALRGRVDRNPCPFAPELAGGQRSRPSRARGSKPWHQAFGLILFDGVQPFAASGSKPLLAEHGIAIVQVAPFAGAWIETASHRPRARLLDPRDGRALRGRVDRNNSTPLAPHRCRATRVAPFAGAWIETK